jgi:hypothetical protein
MQLLWVLKEVYWSVKFWLCWWRLVGCVMVEICEPPHHCVCQYMFLEFENIPSPQKNWSLFKQKEAINSQSPINFFGCFGETRVWIQGFVLAKQALYHFIHTSSPFCSGYFGHRVSWIICPGWSWTVILHISDSQATRITDVSHHHLAPRDI